jgi:hypothetical protein
VNIAKLSPQTLSQIAHMNAGARFISTSAEPKLPDEVRSRACLLTSGVKDKWAILSDHLDIDYPAFTYPGDLDLGARAVRRPPIRSSVPTATNLRSDKGPWILNTLQKSWRGVSIDAPRLPQDLAARIDWTAGEQLDAMAWKLRDDTFPSNLALFTPSNFEQTEDFAQLILRQESTSVRRLTSGAIACRRSYRFGRFAAELRPAGIPGTVTGFFLHRNGPRQEIDIEFLGKDTNKMLVNVFYNPGPEGTKLEYGYRGTPTLIDLGFDASESFHTYEIDWQPDAIRWRVDGNVVHERLPWAPTPIPDQPLELNFNLWHSRSQELAGRLDLSHLPTTARIRSIAIYETRGQQHPDTIEHITAKDAK